MRRVWHSLPMTTTTRNDIHTDLFYATVTFALPTGELKERMVCDTFAFTEARAIMTAKYALAQWYKVEDLTPLNVVYRKEVCQPRTEPYGV